MFHFTGEFETKYVKKKHHEDCALLVAPIVALRVCRFYKFFWVFLWRFFFMQVKLVSALESKEQLILLGYLEKVLLTGGSG